jgi:hypothetical protein
VTHVANSESIVDEGDVALVHLSGRSDIECDFHGVDLLAKIFVPVAICIHDLPVDASFSPRLAVVGNGIAGVKEGDKRFHQSFEHSTESEVGEKRR